MTYKTVEVEVELDDVLDFLDGASQYELNRIEEVTKEFSEEYKSSVDELSDLEKFKVENLYDRDKLLILKKAMDKYNLDELIEKLDITQVEAM